MIAGILAICLAAPCVVPTAGTACKEATKAGETLPRSAHNAGRLERFEYAQVHMGTRFRVVLYARDPTAANEAVRAAFGRVAQLDRILSDYDPQSELSQLSASSPSRQPVPVSDDLWRVLWQAQEFAERSNGAFDVTLGPLTSLWRQSRKNGRLPTAEELAKVRQSVGYKNLWLDVRAKSAQLMAAGMRLDLGGIAKGYAADEALRTLKSRGIQRALVAASGDIAVGAPPPDRKGWQIAVGPLQADDGKELAPARMLVLANAAVSTSGEAEQHVDIGGVRYSHIIDPHTGVGLTTTSRVTIVAPRCMDSDALATAVCVMKPADGLKLLNAMPGTEGLFVVTDKDGTRTTSTANFSNLETTK